jgi:hypothetical protein
MQKIEYVMALGNLAFRNTPSNSSGQIPRVWPAALSTYFAAQPYRELSTNLRKWGFSNCNTLVHTGLPRSASGRDFA